MALVKITFDGSSVTAKQDADINYHLTGLVASGIIKGLGSELSYSSSNNYITFNDGYVQIYGRRIYVETGTRVYISLDSSKYGYVIISVNLANNTASIGVAEASNDYPTLTQQNLATGGTIYQMPIAKYRKTTTSITLDTSFQRNYIETPLSVANSGYERAVNKIKNIYKYRLLTPVNRGNNMYEYDFSGLELSRSIVFVAFNRSIFFPLPGGFITNHSIATLYVRYLGTDYSVSIEYLPGQQVLISTGTSYLRVDYFYFYQYGEF